jgi:hypothetical protein
MKLATAVKTLTKQAEWLGISGPELLADIEKHGRILYPELVVKAYSVYTVDQQVKKELSCDRC